MELHAVPALTGVEGEMSANDVEMNRGRRKRRSDIIDEWVCGLKAIDLILLNCKVGMYYVELLRCNGSVSFLAGV